MTIKVNERGTDFDTTQNFKKFITFTMMAADFDGSGFAAVDAFFGSSDTGEKIVTDSAKAGNASGNRRRLGVGASQPATTTAQNLSDSTSKRILQVGGSKHKRHRKQGFGGDDNFDEDKTDSEDNGDDDDEEEGRTAIDKSSSLMTKSTHKSATVVVKEAVIIDKLKKKKLGKKERQKAQKTNDAKSQPSSSTTPEQAPEETTVVKKRKRRKVRSRQKNIYKDKRDVKPSHLIPGRRNYQGRPLTEETRTKLHLPKFEKSPFAAEWNDHDNMLDTMPLAVDSSTVVETITKDEVGSLIAPAADRKKKVKRTKYKNL